MKLITALFTAGLLALVSVIPVFAQVPDTGKNGSLTVSPAYVEVSLTKPDEEQKITLTYRNNSYKPLTLEMFPLNFNHADENGTIGFLSQDAGSYSYSLASYLSLEANQLQIDAKETASFTVLVRNRPDLTPGGHYGAIIAKIVSGTPGSDGAQVSPSLSTLVFLRKTGGERYNLSLRETGQTQSVAFSLPKSVQLEFQNEGNIHLVPYGTIEIKDIFGRVIKTGVLNTSSFLVMPESRRLMTVSLQDVSWSLPISFNTLTVQGHDSLHKTTFLYRNSSFYIQPLLGVVILGLFIGTGVIMRRKKQNKNK